MPFAIAGRIARHATLRQHRGFGTGCRSIPELMSSSHCIQADTPLENILAMYGTS